MDAVNAKQDMISEESDHITHVQQEATKADEELSRLTCKYQNKCAGISSKDGDNESLSLTDQISKACTDANTADASAKQAPIKINNLDKTIKVKFF